MAEFIKIWSKKGEEQDEPAIKPLAVLFLSDYLLNLPILGTRVLQNRTELLRPGGIDFLEGCLLVDLTAYKGGH
jgi:hypothetical protein